MRPAQKPAGRQPRLDLLLSRAQIAEAVTRLAGEIARDYRGKDPLLVGVLSGSFIFVADLVRELDIPLTLGFLQASSYRSTASTGAVQVSALEELPVRGRHVLLVEDIVDTGVTLACLVEQFREQAPDSLKVCALMDKPSRRVAPVEAHYLGFTVPDLFVVGYGLDFNQQYRNLPEIYALEAQ